MLKRAFVRPAVIIEYLRASGLFASSKISSKRGSSRSGSTKDADAIGRKSWPVSFHDVFQLLKAGSFSPIQA